MRERLDELQFTVLFLEPGFRHSFLFRPVSDRSRSSRFILSGGNARMGNWAEERFPNSATGAYCPLQDTLESGPPTPFWMKRGVRMAIGGAFAIGPASLPERADDADGTFRASFVRQSGTNRP